MATIISTKTSGVGGLSVTGDASGVLELASANGTTAVTIDASQNVTFANPPAIVGTNLTGTSNSLNAGIGVNQTWQAVTRTSGTTYYNTTGKSIQLNLMSYGSVGANVAITVGGVLANSQEFSSLNNLHAQSVTIPTGSSYIFAVTNGTRNGGSAVELR